MGTAGVFIRALPSEVLHPLHSPGGVEHQLGDAAVQILAPEYQSVGIFVIVDGQRPAINLAGCRVHHLYGDFLCGNLENRIVHANHPTFSALTEVPFHDSILT